MDYDRIIEIIFCLFLPIEKKDTSELLLSNSKPAGKENIVFNQIEELRIACWVFIVTLHPSSCLNHNWINSELATFCTHLNSKSDFMTWKFISFRGFRWSKSHECDSWRDIEVYWKLDMRKYMSSWFLFAPIFIMLSFRYVFVIFKFIFQQIWKPCINCCSIKNRKEKWKIDFFLFCQYRLMWRVFDVIVIKLIPLRHSSF